MNALSGQRAPWSIVVADTHGPEWAPTADMGEHSTPVQYSRLGGSTTLLQRALQRATRIAPVSQVLVTALEGYRHDWEPTLWFVRPEHRFVSENRLVSSFAVAAAILSIAATSRSQIIVILPGRCHVSQEEVLSAAIERALLALPRVPEGVLSLAMIDGLKGIDEDYLLVGGGGIGPGLRVLGRARRPTAWVAGHLRRQGALIESGIMIGYAGIFANHISRQWPGLTQTLTQLVKDATANSAECDIPLQLSRRIPRAALTSLGGYSPALPQRALCISGCGWSGLASAQAVSATVDYIEALARVGSSSASRSASLTSSLYYPQRRSTHDAQTGVSI